MERNGSFKDKTFKPTKKIILKDDYSTREEAYADEIILQKYYKVVENTQFANRSYQTSTKFHLDFNLASKNGKIIGEYNKNNNIGFFQLSQNELSENGKKGGFILYENKLGIHGLTKEELSIVSKKGYQNGLAKITKEQRREINKKVNQQKWMCTETSYVTNPGALSKYQKAKGIDTSKRKRIS